MTPDLIIGAIKKAAPFVSRLVIDQLQRNEVVIKILKDFNLDPAHPPEDFDGVYAYALVEYGVYKPELMLKFFRDEEVKRAFWQACASDPSNFLHEAEVLLASESLACLGNDIRDSNIELRSEITEFLDVFVNVTGRTKKPREVIQGNSKIKEFLVKNSPYPEEFKSLIEGKTQIFCGRNFVFREFLQFIDKNPNGYFTVVGDAGMGKSAIAAKYVSTTKCPCYFNIRSEGRNKPELFLKSIRQQLIKHYHLQDAGDADLPTLLAKVSEKLPNGERLVIVVDALDEVEQEERDKNILYLPKDLPKRAYFLLTRRPYNQARLNVSPDVPMKELDLTDEKYIHLNRDDVEQYIRLFLNTDPNHKDALRKWIKDRSVTDEVFVEQVAEKSENNFMYLRYVLPGIANGDYNNLQLEELPKGLESYYQEHWVRMGMEKDDKPQVEKVIVLFVLVEIGTPIPCEMIAEIAAQDESDVQDVLDDWVEYLTDKEIDGETCYSFYHASFVDFLKGKKELKSKRKLFKEVNQRIVDYWEREMDENDADDAEEC